MNNCPNDYEPINKGKCRAVVLDRSVSGQCIGRQCKNTITYLKQHLCKVHYKVLKNAGRVKSYVPSADKQTVMTAVKDVRGATSKQDLRKRVDMIMSDAFTQYKANNETMQILIANKVEGIAEVVLFHMAEQKAINPATRENVLQVLENAKVGFKTSMMKVDSLSTDTSVCAQELVQARKELMDSQQVVQELLNDNPSNAQEKIDGLQMFLDNLPAGEKSKDLQKQLDTMSTALQTKDFEINSWKQTKQNCDERYQKLNNRFKVQSQQSESLYAEVFSNYLSALSSDQDTSDILTKLGLTTDENKRKVSESSQELELQLNQIKEEMKRLQDEGKLSSDDEQQQVIKPRTINTRRKPKRNAFVGLTPRQQDQVVISTIDRVIADIDDSKPITTQELFENVALETKEEAEKGPGYLSLAASAMSATASGLAATLGYVGTASKFGYNAGASVLSHDATKYVANTISDSLVAVSNAAVASSNDALSAAITRLQSSDNRNENETRQDLQMVVDAGGEEGNKLVAAILTGAGQAGAVRKLIQQYPSNDMAALKTVEAIQAIDRDARADSRTSTKITNALKDLKDRNGGRSTSIFGEKVNKAKIRRACNTLRLEGFTEIATLAECDEEFFMTRDELNEKIRKEQNDEKKN